MSLLIISEQIALHIIFYIEFCFMHQETIEDYVWILTRLKVLYLQMKLTSSTVIITDMKRELMTAIENVFFTISYLLCLWHINKNVLTKCKRSFDTQKEWNVFYVEWKSVVYAASKLNFETLWRQFNIKYSVKHAEEIKYLITIYMSFRQRFIKCYTNKVLHFETTITSRDESEHATLKRQLRSSNNDLKAVIDEIILLLTNELHNHLIVINSAKDRYFINLRKSIFQRLTSHVTLHVLRKVLL
jgi:hypothetical protein